MRTRVHAMPALALSVALLVPLSDLVAPPAAHAARRPHAAGYLAPVEAPVRDPFRAPACTWCPGNRGLEYATSPGQQVLASAAGRVAFSGSVAGVLWVVVDHPDGLRTSYGHLEDAAVAVGDRLVARQLLGTSSGRLHFGVRRGDTYVDPARLLGGGALVPRLVPADGGTPRWPRAS